MIGLGILLTLLFLGAFVHGFFFVLAIIWLVVSVVSFFVVDRYGHLRNR